MKDDPADAVSQVLFSALWGPLVSIGALDREPPTLCLLGTRWDRASGAPGAGWGRATTTEGAANGTERPSLSDKSPLAGVGSPELPFYLERPPGTGKIETVPPAWVPQEAEPHLRTQ